MSKLVGGMQVKQLNDWKQGQSLTGIYWENESKPTIHGMLTSLRLQVGSKFYLINANPQLWYELLSLKPTTGSKITIKCISVIDSQHKFKVTKCKS